MIPRGRDGGPRGARGGRRVASRARAPFGPRIRDADSDGPAALSVAYYSASKTDDPRISKLMRRLCSEADPEKALRLCLKLREAVALPENSRYVRRSYEALADSLLLVMREAGDAAVEAGAAEVLGRVGAVMGPDYPRHLEWTAAELESQKSEEVRRLLALSFAALLEFDAESPRLAEYAAPTIRRLQTVAETTDSSKVFAVAVDALVALAEAYPDAFAKRFIDTVDILIGWHMDASQSAPARELALETLGRFGRHWRSEAAFSVGLLGQFIDDVVAYGESLERPPPPENGDKFDLRECVQSATSSISVFNAVAKCLGDVFSFDNSKTVTWTFLSESFGKILKTVKIALQTEFNRDCAIAGNESIYLLLDKLHGNVSSNSTVLFELMDLQLEECDRADEKCTIVLLDAIRKIIKEVSSNLPAQFIKSVIGPSSPVRRLKNSPNEQIKETVISVYQYLLNLKNIPLLQDVYRYVLEDLENAYKTLVPDAEILPQNSSEKICYDEAGAQYTILFNLRCLSEIANAGNSIIGMWALQPSILELLAVKLTPYDDRLTANYPLIQYSVVYLLYSHCKRNNHFIASSDLVSFGQQRSNMCDLLRLSNIKLGETSTTSPTIGHFAIILALFNKLFRCGMPADTLILLLNWTADIFGQLVNSYSAVFHTKFLSDLILDCINVGYSYNERLLRAVLKNLDIIMKARNINMKFDIMKKLSELCIIQSNNNNAWIRRRFCSIFALIPWDVLLDVTKVFYSKVEKYKNTKCITLSGMNIKSSQKEHLMKDSFGQMTGREFKLFMNYLLSGANFDNKELKNIFLNCWPIQNSRGENSHLEFFRSCALNFNIVLTMWATWQAAQLCTSLKLRTPLGKPQDTFTSIESGIKKLAREFTSHEPATNQMKNAETLLMKLRRSRLLIEFFEFLEKSMQNAIDGCATVLLPMEKPVRTFFHTNSSTCQEWLSRVRPAAIAVALHTGHASAAVRHAQSLLYIPTLTNSSLTPDLLLHCVTLARSLLVLKEPEALIGMYVWIHRVYHRKLSWLKAAADQGAKKYEKALNFYLNIMHNLESNNIENNDDNPSALLDCEKKFINDQIIECYKCVHFWEELINWSDMQSEINTKDGLQQLNVNFADIFCYNKFQEDGVIFPNELCDWNVLSFDDNSENIVNMLDRTEISLKNIALKIMYDRDYMEKAPEDVDNCIEFIQSALQELLRNQPCEMLSGVHIMHYAATSLKNIVFDRKQMTIPFLTSLERTTLKYMDPVILNKTVWWLDYFHKLVPTEIDCSFVENIRLDLVKSSRKHGNYKLSNKELMKYYHYSDHFQSFPGKRIENLEEICALFLRSSYDINVWTSNNVIAVMETAKLLYIDDNTKEMAMNLCASASLGVSQKLALGEDTYEFREKGTRMLLTLSKWVQNENDKLLTNNLNSPLTKLVTALPEIGLVNNNVSAHVIPISDSAVGKLLQFSVNQCPGFAKAWFTFGSWCFRWGKKMVEFSSNTGGQLTETDKMQIQGVILQHNHEDFEAVCEILSKTSVVCDDEDIDWSDINTSDMIENQLRSVPCLRNTYPENLIVLVDIWRQAQKRVYSYYELSADAYFKFLDLSSSCDNINHNGECAVVTATLRLLQLIVKHAMELQNVLETGLAHTPTEPWKVIIPQLFSRLNHPESYVRCRVSELLCRLAEDAPHLITFPAVVGAVENKRNNITDLSKSVYLDSDDNELEMICNIEENVNDEANDDYLNSCFKDMVDTLSKQAPETILQVQLLVKELRRINLLWDELWLRTLSQHHSGITKRLIQLNSEINKVNNNINLQPGEKEKLVVEKHRIFMKPILFVLEQLAEITNAPPETPYEKSFQEKFGDHIKEMLNKLQNPNQLDKPLEFLQPIKQLQLKLQQKSNKRSLYVLKMSDISPVLANMQNTVISMPGVQTSSKIRITIMSINNMVAILPSKTKPKKLIFHSSNGRTYTYLFKGLEDLHLDERIMQFLSITNIMMAQDKEDNSCQTYRAHHYSVIPLGPRSGLISWVENLTPLFALYKRWQQRDAIAALTKNNSNKSNVVLRPSELFYNKLVPLLTAAGVSTENRKEWPPHILKQVLVELMTETPNDLLAKELWSSSITPGQWWRTVRRYSFSVAVMSVIGYIIGLGDRHLDNVLIDLNTGEVVHIDYNVCFEDGKTLRVPEKVPFRMTPNLERCLGATGVEGIFRMACEHVLKTMKQGRKTLLTLLEAFVYDPLVEWSGEAGGGAAAGGAALALPGRASAIKTAAIERKCGLDLLAVRIFEIRHSWIENRNEMLKHLPLLHQHIVSWSEHQQALISAESQLQQKHLQLALIKELEAMGTDLSEHPLYLAAQNYASYKQMKDALEDSAKGLLDLHEDCVSKIDNFVVALEAIKGPQLGRWIEELNFPIDHDDHLVFNLIHEFLLNAGQSSMITQCEQSEAELRQCARQQTLLIKNCLELLSQFSTMAQFFPQNFLEKHRVALHRNWAAHLLETDSPEACNDLITQINSFRSSENPNSPAMQQVITFTYQLQTLHNDINIKINKLNERLKAEGGPDALMRNEKNFQDANNAISNFISQGVATEKAIECVIINNLCNLNRRFLILENSAQSAGERLVDLTSREGDWFLDDMNVISSLVAEFMNFIPSHHESSQQNDDRIPHIFDCLRSTKSIFLDLKELSSNFQAIILPEAIRKIQSEEPSVLMMISELNSVVINTECTSLNDLLAQLDMHLRYVIMEMESPSTRAHMITSDLKMRYRKLVDSGTNCISTSTSPTPGQMLLMGSDGLFNQLGTRGIAVLDKLANLNIPHIWKKVDQIIEASDLSATLNNEQLRCILDDIFFIKRIQAIIEFFNLCSQMSYAFKGIGPIAVYDDEKLCKPIKRFMADYITRHFVGIHSQCVSVAICLLLQRLGLNINKEIEQRHIGVSWKVPLNDLCETSIGTLMKASIFTPSLLQQASALVSNFESAFRRRETVVMLEKNKQLQDVCMARLRLQMTVHSWLRGEGRGIAGAPTPAMELRRAAHQLVSQRPHLSAALEKHRGLVASAEQRLKWAAGANPALNEVMAAFECAVNIREDRLNVEQSLACTIGNACASLGALSVSGSGGNSGMWTGIRDIGHLATRRRSALSLLARSPNTPAPIHEALLQLVKPEGIIDAQWVKKVSVKLSEKITSLQKSLVELKSTVTVNDEILQKAAAKLNALKTTHDSLIFDSKSLLKVMSKTHESIGVKAQEYLLKQKAYIGDITELVDSLNSVNTSEKKILISKLISKIESDTKPIYDELISFEMVVHDEESSSNMKRRGTLVRQMAGIWNSPAKQSVPPKGRNQQANAYAVSVWKRVRLKLEGRDPDPARKHSNQEQVDYIIKEAMSLDNLCLLYEGWTPWV